MEAKKGGKMLREEWKIIAAQFSLAVTYYHHSFPPTVEVVDLENDDFYFSFSYTGSPVPYYEAYALNRFTGVEKRWDIDIFEQGKKRGIIKFIDEFKTENPQSGPEDAKLLGFLRSLSFEDSLGYRGVAFFYFPPDKIIKIMCYFWEDGKDTTHLIKWALWESPLIEMLLRNGYNYENFLKLTAKGVGVKTLPIIPQKENLLKNRGMLINEKLF